MIAVLLLGTLTTAQPVGDPLAIATTIGHAAIRDASFAVRQTPWEATQAVQVLDFAQFNGGRPVSAPGRARHTLTLAAPATIRFGLAGAGVVRLRIAGHSVPIRDYATPTSPVEYAYDHFRWPDAFELALPTGTHPIEVEIEPRAGRALLFLQATTTAGAADSRVVFGDAARPDWQIATDRATWRPAPRPLVEDFAVNPAAAFTRHSLVEWHYANGNTHLALLDAEAAAGDPALFAQARLYAEFTLDNLPRHRRQFEEAHVWRGANYRLFRGCLLDDTTAPALPLVELLRLGRDPHPATAALVDDLLDFLLHRHPRLADGTLARDEPEPATVWADDLFMSGAFLIRAAAWKKDPSLFDEAVLQSRNFHQHLLNPATGLYWHGYYAARHTPAAFHWGRANGWMAWSAAEMLRFLPVDHPGRPTLLAAHRAHLRALLPLQAPSGLWHQVLDHPESYEETSATAMFLIALARGVREGWLDAAEFAEPARRAWAGLQTKIDADGRVRDICRGTGIGDTLPYYFTRPTATSDPRGLGAVITAAVEAARLPQHP